MSYTPEFLGLGYDFDVVLEAAQFVDKNDDIVFIIREASARRLLS